MCSCEQFLRKTYYPTQIHVQPHLNLMIIRASNINSMNEQFLKSSLQTLLSRPISCRQSVVSFIIHCSIIIDQLNI